MAVKQVITCDLTGKYLGESQEAVARIQLQIDVPGGKIPRSVAIDATHADPDLAELLLRTIVTHLERSGLHVWSDGSVHTEAEVLATEDR